MTPDKPAMDEKGAWHWLDGSVIPPVPEGAERSFIVAVRRAHNGKTYGGFPAIYLNAFPLIFEPGQCPNGTTCQGNGCEDGCPITGWHTADSEGEYDSNYHRLLKPGDELVAWTYIPKFETLATPQPAPEAEVKP